MNERTTMNDDEAMDSLLIKRVHPKDGMLADNVGEYLVIFNASVKLKNDHLRREQIIVRFQKRDARDKWWRRYCERYNEVSG